MSLGITIVLIILMKTIIEHYVGLVQDGFVKNFKDETRGIKSPCLSTLVGRY